VEVSWSVFETLVAFSLLSGAVFGGYYEIVRGKAMKECANHE
jgi:hypothetical protein